MLHAPVSTHLHRLLAAWLAKQCAKTRHRRRTPAASSAARMQWAPALDAGLSQIMMR